MDYRCQLEHLDRLSVNVKAAGKDGDLSPEEMGRQLVTIASLRQNLRNDLDALGFRNLRPRRGDY